MRTLILLSGRFGRFGALLASLLGQIYVHLYLNSRNFHPNKLSWHLKRSAKKRRKARAKLRLLMNDCSSFFRSMGVVVICRLGLQIGRRLGRWLR